MRGSALHRCFYSFFIQKCLGLFTRGFLVCRLVSILYIYVILFAKTHFFIPSLVTF